MFSRFAKGLFVATSLAPVLAAFAMKDLADGKTIYDTIPLIAVALLLPLVCWLLIVFARRQLERQNLVITKVTSTDKEILAYLVAYLLPLLAKDSIDYRDTPGVTAFVFGIIFLAVLHSNSFHFNPLLGCIGYHFYEIEADDGMTYLLITSETVRKQKMTSQVVQLAEYIFLEVERSQ